MPRSIRQVKCYAYLSLKDGTGATLTESSRDLRVIAAPRAAADYEAVRTAILALFTQVQVRRIDLRIIAEITDDFGAYVGSQQYKVAITDLEAATWTNAKGSCDTLAAPTPTAPSGLATSGITVSNVTLTWTDNASGELQETGFKIERKTGAGDFSEIATAGANATSYNDTSAVAGTSYTYRVRAYNQHGSSKYSNEASATTPGAPAVPGAPSGLTATDVSSSQINLGWLPGAGADEDGFYVERAPDVAGSPGTFAQIGQTIADSFLYSDVGLAASTKFWYRVRAFNQGGNSGYSGNATDTTQAGSNVAPLAATGVTVTPNGAYRNDITWTDASNNEDGFIIEFAQDNGANFSEAGRVGPGIVAFSHRNTPPGQDLRYRVTAWNAFGMTPSAVSAVSASAAVVPGSAPVVPTSLSAVAISTTEVDLEWQLPVAGTESSIRIEQSDNGSTSWVEVATAEAGVGHKRITGLPVATQRFWRIRARNSVGDSAYTSTVNATTRASGVKSPTGANPRMMWTGQWLDSWLAAKAAHDANPTTPGEIGNYYKKLKARGDVFNISSTYGDAGGSAAIMYALTGVADYAARWYAYHELYWTGVDHTITSGVAPTTTVFTVDIAPQFYPTVGDVGNIVGGGVHFLTGVNAGKRARITAYNAATKQVTITGSGISVAPSVGDTVQILALPGIGSNGNAIRDLFIDFNWMYELCRQGLTATQRRRFINLLNWTKDYCLALDMALYVGGTDTSDSDAVMGYVLGMLLVSQATGAENTEAAAIMTTPQANNGTGSAGIAISSLDPTGIDRTTYRNTLAEYAVKARGGEWIESTEYNSDTLQYPSMGVEALRTLLGVERFPEYRKHVFRGMGPWIIQHYSPDLFNPAKWGDAETGRGSHQPPEVSHFMVMAGPCRVFSDVAPYVQQFVYELMQKYPSSAGDPYPRAYVMWRPDAPRSDWRAALPKGHSSPFMGQHYYHRAWGVNDSLLALSAPIRVGVHHEQHPVSSVQIYRRQEWGLTNIWYYGQYPADYWNTYILAGLAGMSAARGPIVQEIVEGEYVYLVAGTHGSLYGSTYFAPPPPFCFEATRSHFYLSGATCDTVVVFDRLSLANPRNLANQDRYAGYTLRAGKVTDAAGTTTSAITNYGDWWGMPAAGWTLKRLDNGETRIIASYVGATSRVTVTAAFSTALGDQVNLEATNHHSDYKTILDALALRQVVFHCALEPVITVADRTTWATPGGQNVRVTHLYAPTGFQRIKYDEAVLYPGGSIPATEKKWQFRQYSAAGAEWPAGTAPIWENYLNVVQLFDTGATLTNTAISADGGNIRGALVQRSGENDVLVLFSNSTVVRVRSTGFSVTYTAGTATSTIYVCDLDPTKSWQSALDGGGPQALTVSREGVGKVVVAGSGAHTLQLTAS